MNNQKEYFKYSCTRCGEFITTHDVEAKVAYHSSSVTYCAACCGEVIKTVRPRRQLVCKKCNKEFMQYGAGRSRYSCYDCGENYTPKILSKEQITRIRKIIIDNYNSKTYGEIAKIAGIKKSKVQYHVNTLRKNHVLSSKPIGLRGGHRRSNRRSNLYDEYIIANYNKQTYKEMANSPLVGVTIQRVQQIVARLIRDGILTKKGKKPFSCMHCLSDVKIDTSEYSKYCTIACKKSHAEAIKQTRIYKKDIKYIFECHKCKRIFLRDWKLEQIRAWEWAYNNRPEGNRYCSQECYRNRNKE